jgi:hypothetical protein
MIPFYQLDKQNCGENKLILLLAMQTFINLELSFEEEKDHKRKI